MSDYPTPDATAEPKPLPLRSIEPQALDIQHDTDPADDHGKARRIPHLGHALLFFSFLIGSLALAFIVTFAIAHLHTAVQILAHPGLGLLAQGAAYLLALLISVLLFPLLWDRTFLDGIHWNFPIAVRRWPRIVASGFLLSVLVMVATPFVAKSGHAPIDDLLQNARLIWATAFFAVILGPLMEELAFRGFLLPALATAYDWLALERSPAGLQRWQSSSAHSNAALVFAAILSSIPFALMHAAQIGYAWGVVVILYGVSLALSYVRIRSHSLACSTLLHASYNFTIFALLFVSTHGFQQLQKLAH
jgi:membrane protease YdiL (CAAX protease family)